MSGIAQGIGDGVNFSAQTPLRATNRLLFGCTRQRLQHYAGEPEQSWHQSGHIRYRHPLRVPQTLVATRLF